MSSLVYVQINIIPIIALLFLLVDSKLRLISTLNNRLLRRIIICLVTIMIFDSVAWVLNGRSGDCMRVVLWVCNLVFLIFTVMLPFLWTLFVFKILFTENNSIKPRTVFLLSIPLIVCAVLMLITPSTGFFFKIDSNNCYERGDYIVIHQAVSFAYLVIPSILALIQRNRESSTDKKHECTVISMFAVLPLLGGLVQAYVYGISLTWSCAAASFISMYINLQRSNISIDMLTGLNNRRRFDMFFLDKCEDSDRPWYLVIIDIDDFKKINDTYGHLSGDEALKHVSEILKGHFNKSNMFIARYGGDEFAVIISGIREYAVVDLLMHLNSISEGYEKYSSNPWSISLSSGYVRCECGKNDPAVILKAADDKMYAEKNKKKEH